MKQTTVFVPTDYTSYMTSVGFVDHFHDCSCFRFKPGALNIDVLAEVISALPVNASDLCNQLAMVEGRGLMYNMTGSRPVLEVIPASQYRLEHETKKDAAQRFLADVQRKAFELYTDKPLIRFLVLPDADKDEGWLVFLAHHYLTDGIGLVLIFNLIEDLYRQLLAGTVPPQPQKRPTIFDYLDRRQRYTHEELPLELPFWRSLPWHQLSGPRNDSGNRPNTHCLPSYTEHDQQALHEALLDRHEAEAARLSEKLCVCYGSLSSQASRILVAEFGDEAGFASVDIFVLSVYEALKARLDGALWMDLIVSGRFGVFTDAGFSRCIADLNEFAPIWVASDDGRNTLDRLRSLHNRRIGMPCKGIGFHIIRSLNSTYMADLAPDTRAWPRPKIGLNYQVAFQHDMDITPFGMPILADWLGSEGGNRSAPFYNSPHEIGFMVSYEDGIVSIFADYLPQCYDHHSVRSILDTMISFIEATTEELATSGFKR